MKPAVEAAGLPFTALLPVADIQRSSVVLTAGLPANNLEVQPQGKGPTEDLRCQAPQAGPAYRHS